MIAFKERYLYPGVNSDCFYLDFFSEYKYGLYKSLLVKFSKG